MSVVYPKVESTSDKQDTANTYLSQIAAASGGGGAASAANTQITPNTSSTAVLASNASRQRFSLYNNSTGIAYVIFGATATLSSFTVAIQVGAYYEPPINYTGALAAIWSASATGKLLVTELS